MWPAKFRRITASVDTVAHAAYLTFVALARSPEGHSGPPASIRLPGRKFDRPLIRPKVKKVLPATLIEKKRYLLAGHRRELRLAAGKKANGGMAAFRAEVLTMSSSLHSELTMSPRAEHSKVISDMEKELIADALSENDPSVVHSVDPTGEEVVSLAPGLYDGLGSPAPVIRLSEIKETLNQRKRGRRNTWTEPGNSMDTEITRSTTSWMLEPGSPSKRMGGRKLDIPVSISERSMLFDDPPGDPLRFVPIEDTYASTLHIVMPQHANSNGVLFGGQLMGKPDDVSSRGLSFTHHEP